MKRSGLHAGGRGYNATTALPYMGWFQPVAGAGGRYRMLEFGATGTARSRPNLGAGATRPTLERPPPCQRFVAQDGGDNRRAILLMTDSGCGRVRLGVPHRRRAGGGVTVKWLA
jgi:hypothetical protein